MHHGNAMHEQTPNISSGIISILKSDQIVKVIYKSFHSFSSLKTSAVLICSLCLLNIGIRAISVYCELMKALIPLI